MSNKHFGFEGSPPPIEYIYNFIRTYSDMKQASNSCKMKRKPTEEEVGHFVKAAWASYRMDVSPEEYIRTLILKYQSMPDSTAFPRANQLSSKFAIDVVEYERIQRVERHPDVRAQELARENRYLNLKKDDQYRQFASELKAFQLEEIEDARFKSSYCGMRETQTWGEPTDFIKGVQEKLSILQKDELP